MYLFCVCQTLLAANSPRQTEAPRTVRAGERTSTIKSFTKVRFELIFDPLVFVVISTRHAFTERRIRQARHDQTPPLTTPQRTSSIRVLFHCLYNVSCSFLFLLPPTTWLHALVDTPCMGPSQRQSASRLLDPSSSLLVTRSRSSWRAARGRASVVEDHVFSLVVVEAVLLLSSVRLLLLLILVTASTRLGSDGVVLWARVVAAGAHGGRRACLWVIRRGAAAIGSRWRYEISVFDVLFARLIPFAYLFCGALEEDGLL